MSFARTDVSFEVGGWDGDRSGRGSYFEPRQRAMMPQIAIHECGFLPEGHANWNNLHVYSSVWRAYYFLRSGCWIEHREQRYEITPQQIIIVPQSLACAFRSSRQVPQMWIHFSFVPAHTFYSATPLCVPVDVDLRQQLKRLITIQSAFKATTGRAMEDDAELLALYHQAMAVLHNCFARCPLHIRLLPPAMQKILQDINEAPHKDYSCARLAKRFGIDGSSLTRWFREHLGENPSAYAQRIRLDKAYQLLAFSDLSLEQIAAELGFTNRHYFSRAFARHAGCGPATFRKRYRERPMNEAG